MLTPFHTQQQPINIGTLSAAFIVQKNNKKSFVKTYLNSSGEQNLKKEFNLHFGKADIDMPDGHIKKS
jgi:hypothetical protein